MAISGIADDKLKGAIETYVIAGEGNVETINRYKREAKKRFPEWLDFIESTAALRENYTKEEVVYLVNKICENLTGWSLKQ